MDIVKKDRIKKGEMMYLCYAYIQHYKCLDEIELNLDARYIIKYNKETKELTYTENENFPINFWGDAVVSVCGIVGDNGAGKSTAMSFLLNAIVNGRIGTWSQNFQGILVYNKDGKFYVCSSDSLEILFNFGTPNNIQKIPCFYYSGHFSPFVNSDVRTRELAELYNASEIIRLVRSPQEYYNKNSGLLQNSLIEYLRCHVAQNNYRICTMLANYELRKVLQEYYLPQYILLKKNYAGRNGLESEYYNKKRNFDISLLEEPKISEYPYPYPQEQFMSDFIYYNILNVIYENNTEIDFDILQRWKDKVSSTPSILEQFLSFINTIDISEKSKSFLQEIHNVALEIQQRAKYKDNTFDGFFYLDIREDEDIKWLTEISRRDFYLTSKFFDFSYANNVEEETLLSSGEKLCLDLFSRIYDAIITHPEKSKNIKVPTVLFFDEAEIAFHPEWQRRYINLIVHFLIALREIKKDLPKLQIILSTHSPILLSDIPKCCVNFLKKENGITKNANVVEETFASNVFNLYHNSFFMENGLIGKYASEKIKRICNDIENLKTPNDKLLIEIKLIGDVGIREYLIQQYQEKFPNDDSVDETLLNYYRNKITEIENKKKNYE